MSNSPVVILIAISLVFTSFALTSAFAEPSIEVSANPENIKSLDTVLITGKITGVAEYKPVKITVMAPDGAIVYAPMVPIGDNGEFKKLLHPTIPSFKAGTYKVIASHEETQVTAQTQFTVTAQNLPRNEIEQSPIAESTASDEKITTASRGITISADAINGSDTIKISGNTNFRGTDITMIVSSPTGNIITIAQVTPGPFGNFEMEIKTGGSLWKEDGEYTITANQGTSLGIQRINQSRNQRRRCHSRIRSDCNASVVGLNICSYLQFQPNQNSAFCPDTNIIHTIQ